MRPSVRLEISRYDALYATMNSSPKTALFACLRGYRASGSPVNLLGETIQTTGVTFVTFRGGAGRILEVSAALGRTHRMRLCDASRQYRGETREPILSWLYFFNEEAAGGAGEVLRRVLARLAPTAG
jgi:hypothetical protein